MENQTNEGRDMKNIRVTADGFVFRKLSKGEALGLYCSDGASTGSIYKLYQDNTEAEVESAYDFLTNEDCEYGIEVGFVQELVTLHRKESGKRSAKKP